MKPDQSDIEQAFPVNRSVIKFTTIEEAAEDDRNYWRGKTPQERMTALEALRRMAYGYGPTASGLSGPVEMLECPWG